MSQPEVVGVKVPRPPPAAPAAESPPVTDQKQAVAEIRFGQPCIVGGLNAGFSAGVLGFFFGAVPSMFKNRSLASRGIWAADGWRSAMALAVMSGLYNWVHCLCQRVRLTEDAWNRGFAGGATGLALGWSGGPLAAAQSAAGLGLISYFIDLGGANELPAKAAGTCCSGCSGTHHPLVCEAAQGTTRAVCSPVQHSASYVQHSGQENTRPGIQGPLASISMAGGAVSRHILQASWSHAQAGVQRAGQLQAVQHLPPVMWLGNCMAPQYFQA